MYQDFEVELREPHAYRNIGCDLPEYSYNQLSCSQVSSYGDRNGYCEAGSSPSSSFLLLGIGLLMLSRKRHYRTR